MILFKDLQEKYTKDSLIIEQLKNEFNEYQEFEKEYDDFFNNEYIIQVINESSNGNGHIAGAGPIDYNEGKILFLHIRKHKPELILELGTASGCSSVVIAKALELNKTGKLHTVDISTDNYEAGISLFRKYVDIGIIETKFGVDGVVWIYNNNHIKYDMTFTDADHSYNFCINVVKTLFKFYPTIPHFYHEWSLSSISNKEEKKYISLNEHFGKMFERDAFEEVFSSDYFDHKGFYGSCGLGLVKPKPIKIFYRLSSKNAYAHKNKLPNASKINCLNNFINVFGKENLLIQADNCSNEVIEELKKLNVNFEITNSSSSPESFMMLLERITKLDDNDIVYVVEDDYLHLPEAKTVLFEGILAGADYVTGYDHLDKYIDANKGGNPYIESGGEVTRVILTASSHWKMTNSTCLTFLTTAKSIKEDFDVFKKYTYEVPSLGSFYAFVSLRNDKEKILISSIPGVSTHTEPAWLSPLIDWTSI